MARGPARLPPLILAPVKRPPFFYRETNAIRVTVKPAFLPAQSQPSPPQYVFAYHVRIENVGAQAAQLLSRRWG